MTDRDAVTVYRIEGSARANKRVYRKPDGTIGKDGAVEGGRYMAETVPAPTPAALADILRDIGNDPRMTFGLGLFKDAPAGPFRVWSKSRIARVILRIDPKATPPKVLAEKTAGWFDWQGLRIVARAKVNMVHGTWHLADRDLVRDMPEDLAALAREPWTYCMGLLIPGFDKASLVVVPSTSGRVLVDDKPWSSKASWHAFVQVTDPDDFADRVWHQMLVKAFSITPRWLDCPLGFMRHSYSRSDPTIRIPGRGTPWSIYDPSTCSQERLCYDGAPTVEGAGLTLAPPVVEIVNPGGGRLDPSRFQDVPQSDAVVAARHGVRFKVERDAKSGRIKVEHVTCASLGLALVFDSDLGLMTIKDLWLANAGHVRGQSPYRDSTSEAAYFNQHDSDGTPFLFDTGSATKYVLCKEDSAGPDPADFVEALKACSRRPAARSRARR